VAWRIVNEPICLSINLKIHHHVDQFHVIAK